MKTADKNRKATKVCNCNLTAITIIMNAIMQKNIMSSFTCPKIWMTLNDLEMNNYHLTG